MADVMEERVRSIGLTAGICFVGGALLLALSIVLYPSLPPANETNKILEVLVRQDAGSWMWLHAFMATGFVLATIGFTALAFLLHLRGSSGAASIASSSALVGAALWTAFLTAEFFVHPFITNLMSVEPGLATMLFNTYWFWKMGALWFAGLLLFTAVIAAGSGANARNILPPWLGLGGPVFAALGILVYLFDFLGATATGGAINPMRSAFTRYGVGLPLQIWMLGAGAVLLRDYRDRATVLPPQARTPVPRREREAPPVPLPPPIP
ncbi:MAG TPA: hypothetical protein VF363_07770 [Candidatus Eisenbacteria bacterium]